MTKPEKHITGARAGELRSGFARAVLCSTVSPRCFLACARGSLTIEITALTRHPSRSLA